MSGIGCMIIQNQGPVVQSIVNKLIKRSTG